jgi:hypothetical protein
MQIRMEVSGTMTSAAKTTLFCLVAGMIGTFAGALPIALIFEEDVGLHLLFRLRGPVSPPGDVVVVGIAQDSADQLNLPVSVDQWPRKMHARLIERLNAAGAAFIAIDIVFNEHQTPENDLAFARAIATANNVILAQALAHERISLTDPQGRQTGQLDIEKVISAIPSLCESALAEAPFPLSKLPISLRQYWTFKPGAGDIMTLPVVAFHVYAQHAYRLFTRLLLVERPHLATLFVKDFEEQAFDRVMQNASVLRSLFQKDPQLADRLHKALDDPSGRFTESAHLHHQIKSFIDLYSRDNSRYLNFYGPPDTLPTIPYHEISAQWITSNIDRSEISSTRPRDWKASTNTWGPAFSYPLKSWNMQTVFWRVIWAARVYRKIKSDIGLRTDGARWGVHAETSTGLRLLYRRLARFRTRSWNEARRQFAEVINLLGADGPSTFYLNMCEAYKQSPPGAEWDRSL